MCFPFRRISCPHLHNWTLQYSLQFHFLFLSNLLSSLFIPSPFYKPFLSQTHQCFLWTYNIYDPKKQFAFQAGRAVQQSTQFIKCWCNLLNTRIIPSMVFWNRLTRSILIIQITSSRPGCLSGAVWMLLSGGSGSISLPGHSLWCLENGRSCPVRELNFWMGTNWKGKEPEIIIWTGSDLPSSSPFQFFSDIKSLISAFCGYPLGLNSILEVANPPRSLPFCRERFLPCCHWPTHKLTSSTLCSIHPFKGVFAESLWSLVVSTPQYTAFRDQINWLVIWWTQRTPIIG